MKAIILTGVTTAVVATSFLAAPASATFGLGLASSSSSSSKLHIAGSSKGGLEFSYDRVSCRTSGFALAGAGGGLFGGKASASAQAQAPGCNAQEVVNNPPANSTVTINGICEADAAKVKSSVTGNNVTVIVNTVKCETTATEVPTTPVEVVVTPKAPEPSAPVVTAAAAVSNPKGGGEVVADLPQTGSNEVIAAVVATILAGSTYAGTMAVRAFRARA